MLEAGAKADDVLFTGTVHANGLVDGLSFAYKGKCGPYPFGVTGISTSDKQTIRLYGELPSVDRRCRINGGQHVELLFNVIDFASQD